MVEELRDYVETDWQMKLILSGHHLQNCFVPPRDPEAFQRVGRTRITWQKLALSHQGLPGPFTRAPQRMSHPGSAAGHRPQHPGRSGIEVRYLGVNSDPNSLADQFSSKSISSQYPHGRAPSDKPQSRRKRPRSLSTVVFARWRESKPLRFG